MKLENKFRLELVKALQRERGAAIYTQKHHGSQFSSGLPDMLVVDRDEGTSFLELKALAALPTQGGSLAWSWQKKLTNLQVDTLTRIARAGGTARVVLYVAPLKRVYAYPISNVLLWRTQTPTWTKNDLYKVPYWVEWDGVKTTWGNLRSIVFSFSSV